MNKIIHKLECVLIDHLGNLVRMGDLIRMDIPSYERYGCDTEYGSSDDEWGSRKTIEGVIRLQLSKGLVVKVVGVEWPDNDRDEDDLPILEGQTIKFKQCVEWSLVKGEGQ